MFASAFVRSFRRNFSLSVEIRPKRRAKTEIRVQGGSKEDWATLHASIFIVTDCIEICRTPSENKKCLHAVGCSTPRAPRYLFSISFALLSRYIVCVCVCVCMCLSLHISLFLTFSTTRNESFEEVRNIYRVFLIFLHIPAMVYTTKFDIDYNNSDTLVKTHRHACFSIYLFLLSSLRHVVTFTREIQCTDILLSREMYKTR